jgi:hypothetical protein
MPMDDETMAKLKAQWQVMRDAIEACDLHITVNGAVVPLKDCDWVLRKPGCGCVVTIMSAVQSGEIYATADETWHEIYDIMPHTHRRARLREINRMQQEGWTVEAMLIPDAVSAHRVRCTHEKTTRKVETVSGVDMYEQPEIPGVGDPVNGE